MINYMEKEINYIDILSVLSSFAVVMLHVNGVFWSRPIGLRWFSANLIETGFYFAVPVFFMITGATLIDYQKRYTTKQFFLRRFYRAVIPFLFWSFLAAIFSFHLQNLKDLNFWLSPINFLKILYRTINYSNIHTYWFFYPLFGIYLSIPVLSQINNKIFVFLYMFFFAFTCGSIFPFLNSISPYDLNILHTICPVAGGYLLYPLIGYVLHHLHISKKIRYLIYLLGVCGSLIHMVGTMYCSPINGEVTRLFKGYTNVPAVLQALAVYVWIKNVKWQKVPGFIIQLVKNVRPYTLGIYLIHIPVLRIFQRIIGEYRNYLLFRTIGAIAIFIICVIISKIICYIKIGKIIIGNNK